MNYLKIPAWNKDGLLHAVIESPAGSRIKFSFDPELKVFKAHRPLPLGLAYPFDWGFVPGTTAADGDPLDILVLNDLPSHPGMLMVCKPVGVVRLTEKNKDDGGRESNDRIIASPVWEREYEDLNDIRNVSPTTRREIERFFENVAFLEGKAVKIRGWEGAKEAKKLISKAQSTKGKK